MTSNTAQLSNHESFLILMNDDSGRSALLEFLQTRYSEHHLLFWEEVEFGYQHLQTKEERAESAAAIYARFIKNGTKEQINITEPQRLRLKNAIEAIAKGQTDLATPDLFSEASSTCIELIKGNYYFPFQQTPEYESWKKEKKKREDKERSGRKSNTCVIL